MLALIWSGVPAGAVVEVGRGEAQSWGVLEYRWAWVPSPVKVAS